MVGREVRRFVLLCTSFAGLMAAGCAATDIPVVVGPDHPASVLAPESTLAPVPDPALPPEGIPSEVEPEAGPHIQHEHGGQHDAAPAVAGEPPQASAERQEQHAAHDAPVTPQTQPSAEPEHGNHGGGVQPPQGPEHEHGDAGGHHEPGATEQAQGHAEHDAHAVHEQAPVGAEAASQPAAPESGSGEPHAHGPAQEEVHEHGGHEHMHGRPGLVTWLGKFHPLMVHFPIGLLVAGAVAEALAMWRRLPWLSQAARYCVLAAAVGAMLAAPLGWLAAATRESPPDEMAIVAWHRWLGIAIAFWVSLTGVLSERSARSGWTHGHAAFRFALFLGVLLMSVQGHLGAMLTHGRDYLAW